MHRELLPVLIAKLKLWEPRKAWHKMLKYLMLTALEHELETQRHG